MYHKVEAKLGDMVTYPFLRPNLVKLEKYLRPVTKDREAWWVCFGAPVRKLRRWGKRLLGPENTLMQDFGMFNVTHKC